MDVVLRATEHEFITSCVPFRTFRRKAIGARDKSRGFRTKSVDDFSDIGGFHKAEARRRDILDVIERVRDPQAEYNLKIDEGMLLNVLPSSKLRSVSYLKMENEKRMNPQCRSVSLRSMRYDRIETSLLTMRRKERSEACNPATCCEHLQGCTKDSCISNEAPSPKSCDEVIAIVSVFVGYNRILNSHELRQGRLMRTTDEIALLGSSTLFDLKKSFKCQHDYTFCEDMSERVPTSRDLNMRKFPSSFFFINDTFYIDRSGDRAVDHSKEIRAWAAKRSEIGHLKVEDMQNARISALECRLGMPYVYVHQGQCEHLLAFTDLRLWSESDKPPELFPIKIHEKNYRRVACCGCKVSTAHWYVASCDAMVTSPAFLCDTCYRGFNFDKDGRKLHRFTAVPYCDRKAMDDSDLFLKKLNGLDTIGDENGRLSLLGKRKRMD